MKCDYTQYHISKKHQQEFPESGYFAMCWQAIHSNYQIFFEIVEFLIV